MYELAVQRSKVPIIFSCRFRHGSNPNVKQVLEQMRRMQSPVRAY